MKARSSFMRKRSKSPEFDPGKTIPTYYWQLQKEFLRSRHSRESGNPEKLSLGITGNNFVDKGG
jgi:hypothetical protein